MRAQDILWKELKRIAKQQAPGIDDTQISYNIVQLLWEYGKLTTEQYNDITRKLYL